MTMVVMTTTMMMMILLSLKPAQILMALLFVQVVSLQSHFVKPQPNDLTETVLTDECKEETGLEENAAPASYARGDITEAA
nr:hypothetical protein BaRGS_017866 [Batillaria attramentaria]